MKEEAKNDKYYNVGVARILKGKKRIGRHHFSIFRNDLNDLHNHVNDLEQELDELKAVKDKVQELFAQWDSQMAITSAPTIEEMERNGVIERKIRQQLIELISERNEQLEVIAKDIKIIEKQYQEIKGLKKERDGLKAIIAMNVRYGNIKEPTLPDSNKRSAYDGKMEYYDDRMGWINKALKIESSYSKP